MKNFELITGELTKIGLNKKEASLYLTLLQKGPSSVIQLASLQKFSRPTIYRTLTNLQKKQLVTVNRQKHTARFTANSPENLLQELVLRKRRAEEQEREFLRIISLLRDHYQALSGKKMISLIDPRIALDNFSSTRSKKLSILNFSANKKESSALQKVIEKIKKRLGKDISIDYLSLNKKNKIPVKLNLKTILISEKIFILLDKKAFCINQKELVETFKLIAKIIKDSLV